MYDTTCIIQLVWLCKIANSHKFDVQNICMIQLLKNRMSSISSNLYKGNKPITFHVSQCWIILKKNIVQWGGETFCWKKNMALGARFQKLRRDLTIRRRLNSQRGRGELNSQRELDSGGRPCFSATMLFLWQHCYKLYHYVYSNIYDTTESLT